VPGTGEEGSVAQLPTGTVTFLFTDVEGSTRLFEEHAGDMQAVMARHDELVREVVAQHSGHVVKFTGRRGARGLCNCHGCDRRGGLRTDRDRPMPVAGGVVPRVRAGVHTGEAALRAGDYFGSEVNRAARIMSVAHGGQIVCSASTAELTTMQPNSSSARSTNSSTRTRKCADRAQLSRSE
jgi:class 3 adenylate cyclase